MDAREWLEYILKLDELIISGKAEVKRLKELATDISATPIDGMPRSDTGTVSQKMQNAVLNYVVLEQQLRGRVMEYEINRSCAMKLLERLPLDEYGALHRHYIRRMKWREVAEDMGYSERQIHRIKKKALQDLQDVIECQPKK